MWEYIENTSFYALFITIEYKGGVFKSLGKAIDRKDLDRDNRVMQAQLDFKGNQYFINEVVTIHFWDKPIAEHLLTDK